jgi:hypothetical protein
MAKVSETGDRGSCIYIVGILFHSGIKNFLVNTYGIILKRLNFAGSVNLALEQKY